MSQCVGNAAHTEAQILELLSICCSTCCNEFLLCSVS